jgi:serine/threonine protein kinase
MGCVGSSGEQPAQAAPPASRVQARPLPTGVKEVLVLNKYYMLMGREDIMGEGTSSICRKGVTKDRKKEVAIKVYKEQAKGGKLKDVTLQKFRRQIEVLRDLMAPFSKPSEPELWHEDLEKIQPRNVFMELLDYSKDDKGQPGPDSSDGMLYVVTEIAQFSLKDFLAHRREQQKPLTTDEIKMYSKAIIVAMAGLHAKGYVHIDMKPENMMMFGGRLKVIDVDGCVKKGTKISIQDSSISFSPCYCAPEWAKFLIQENKAFIIAHPALDVWSVGMTMCELITLDAILKPQYANFLRNATSHREAGFLFMEWLGALRKSPVPKSIEKFDKQFVELMTQWLLVASQSSRKSCAQALSSKFIKSCPDQDVESQKASGDEPVRRLRDRPEDDSVQTPLHKGTLYKLNTGGNMEKDDQWIQRDMWIAHNHSLCYFSVKEEKRLVLIDAVKLSTADIKMVKGKAAKGHAFEIHVKSDEDHDGSDVMRLAAESDAAMKEWIRKLKDTSKMDVIVTMKLGAAMAAEIDAFKLAVKNRRLKVEDGAGHEQYEPLYKNNLWKLKAEGDNKKGEDWFKREMWIAKNGSLVYYSKKDERELIYYTTADVHRAKIDILNSGDTCKPFAFRVTLPPCNSVEYQPGEFATETEALRQEWIAQFKKFQGSN